MYNINDFETNINKLLFDIKASKNIDIKTEKAYRSDLHLLNTWCLENNIKNFILILNNNTLYNRFFKLSTT